MYSPRLFPLDNCIGTFLGPKTRAHPPSAAVLCRFLAPYAQALPFPISRV